MRFFNTAGPVNCDDHYCLPPLERFDLKEIEILFTQKKYFVLHAPRQTGKTTCMLALMEHLNNEDNFRALYCNVEAAQAAREDVAQAMNDILREMSRSAEIYLKDTFLSKKRDNFLKNGGHGTALTMLLSAWAEQSEKPLVIIFDEVDCLIGDSLISFLRQIRSGYTQRPSYFPQSIILCGIRDIRDYRIHGNRNKEIITGGSAFNIKAESLRLGDFVEQEVYALLDQHTSETGQKFTSRAKACIWHLTLGQPWLVNALAYETCFKIKEGRNRSMPIDKDMVVDDLKIIITDIIQFMRDSKILSMELVKENLQNIMKSLNKRSKLKIKANGKKFVLDIASILKEKNITLENPRFAKGML